MSSLGQYYRTVLRALVLAVSAVSGVGVLAMMLITCADIVLRLAGRPLIGAFDLVRMAGALTIACALPYTTAVKGHVAIEYFFHKLSRPGRVVVDTVLRLLVMALFGMLAWHSVRYGVSLRAAGELSTTLRLPIFWIPHVIAFSCSLVVLVTLHNLLHPGRTMIKP